VLFMKVLWRLYAIFICGGLVWERMARRPPGFGRHTIMKELTLSTDHIYLNSERVGAEKTRQRWTNILMVSLPISVSLILSALMINGISLALDTSRTVGELGIALTLAVFPMLILAAHAIDKVREADRSIRGDGVARSMQFKSSRGSQAA